MDHAECPRCGEFLGLYDSVYTIDNSDEVAGCNKCLFARSAIEWFAVEPENNWVFPPECLADVNYSEEYNPFLVDHAKAHT